MEITSYGAGCLRLRGREGTVASDAYRWIVGPTGRGLTADVVTYSHADPQPLPMKGRWTGDEPQRRGVVPPTSLESAFALEEPGEYEVHDILINGIRTFRDEAAADGDLNVSFVYELDTLHVAQLGDIGHVLTEDQLREIGTVDVVCLPIGGRLPPAKVAELVAQLDANLIVPLLASLDEAASQADLERFLHEMGVQPPAPQPKLTVTISSLPQETTVVLLEARRG